MWPGARILPNPATRLVRLVFRNSFPTANTTSTQPHFLLSTWAIALFLHLTRYLTAAERETRLFVLFIIAPSDFERTTKRSKAFVLAPSEPSTLKAMDTMYRVCLAVHE